MTEISKKIAKDLLKIQAVFLSPDKPFTWASGIKSPVYCDNRLTLTAPEVRTDVENGLKALIEENYPDAEVLMGTSTAGIAHAAITAHLMGLPMGYVRSGNKDHGRQNRIEGKLEKGQKVVVVEDLISTGGSVIDVVDALREAGAEVLGIVSIFTYGMQKGLDRLAAAEVKNISLTNLDVLSEVAADEGYIKPEDVSRLIAFRQQPLGRELDRRCKMRSIVNILDLSAEEIDQLIAVADDIAAQPEKYNEVCRHKILATLFFEPSTRTRLSFESAMLSLGGQVIGFSGAGSSSASKGETLADTIEVVNGYADIIAMRHPKEGAPVVASMHTAVPLINAGDGGHFHPTQTLADLLTIHREKGTFDNLTIGLCGDLKYGRTVHSLIAAMTRYKNVKFVLISPEELRLPQFVTDEYLEGSGLQYEECRSLEEAMPKLDILYMTRIQRERFTDEAEYQRLNGIYVLDKEKMSLAKSDMCVLHPLPRINEITPEVDSDPRAKYFEQTRCGRLMRMALIMKLLGLIPDEGQPEKAEEPKYIYDKYKCDNPACISVCEPGIRSIFKTFDANGGACRCIYCDKERK